MFLMIETVRYISTAPPSSLRNLDTPETYSCNAQMASAANVIKRGMTTQDSVANTLATATETKAIKSDTFGN